MPKPPTDIQVIRIPLIAESTSRGTDPDKDQRYVNGYFDVFKNSITKKETYFFVKRPGLDFYSNPSATNPPARGMRVWKGAVYSCYKNKIYKNNSALGVTLSTSSGRVFFEFSTPSATNQYLCMNDGSSLYIIYTDDTVGVLNNVVITSSSVANPTVITTATAHGLTTGNKIIIRNHVGATPALNGTVYTITKTGANTFTIPVNVTVGGTGGTLGVFPSPNIKQLLYFDGYFFTQSTSGPLYNSDLFDPWTWDPTKFITPIMDNGTAVGIGRQGNHIYTLGSQWVQGFYDNANATGSPLLNDEAAMLQIGCAGNQTITQDEAYMMWVGASNLGGFTVYRLEGVANLKDVGDAAVNKVLNAEGSNMSNANAFLLRNSGHVFYVLILDTQERTFVYDIDLGVWYEWQAASPEGPQWTMLTADNLNTTTIIQDKFFNIYTLSPTTTTDNGDEFTVLGRTVSFDFDTHNNKFVRSLELIGDKQADSTPVLLFYSDDDFQTYSDPRTLDMADNRPMATNMGKFRRRSFSFKYTGDNPFRLEGFQLKFRLGTD